MPKLLDLCHLGGKTGTNGTKNENHMANQLNATESKGTESISTHTGQMRQRLSLSNGLINNQFKCCFGVSNKALEVISCDQISLI